MTIKECLAQLSAEDLAYVKEYCESIQPFEVEPSATYEFDGEFKDSEGERIGTEITLSGDFQIEDMFCIAYDAFTRESVKDDSERIYLVFRERGK